MSVVRIRESPHYRGFFNENISMGILSGHWKLSVIEVSVLERFDCTAIQFLLIF